MSYQIDAMWKSYGPPWSMLSRCIKATERRVHCKRPKFERKRWTNRSRPRRLPYLGAFIRHHI